MNKIKFKLSPFFSQLISNLVEENSKGLGEERLFLELLQVVYS